MSCSQIKNVIISSSEKERRPFLIDFCLGKAVESFNLKPAAIFIFSQNFVNVILE